jgi:hypothetical protein
MGHGSLRDEWWAGVVQWDARQRGAVQSDGTAKKKVGGVTQLL